MNVLLITLQAPIGRYTADFLLTLRGLTVLERDEERTCPFQAEMIVECDGHEFHEKTKEQAARDRKRDRELQDLGFKVFHFTGREIYNDAFRCADQAIQALLKEVVRQVERAEENA